MRRLLMRFMKDEAGTTAIEYAIIAGGIAVAIVATVQSLGTTTAAQYQSVLDGLQNK